MNHEERIFHQRWGYGCEPTTILALSSLAISGAGAVATAQGEQAQATAKNNYQQELVAANNSVAYGQTSALRIQQQQDTESRTREMEKARQVTQKAQSSAAVAAGEAGVTGNTVDALLSEYQSNLGAFREATTRQGTLNSLAATEQINAIQTNAKYSNLSINAPVSGPNYAAIGLGFAKDAFNAYGAYHPPATKPRT